MLVIVPMMMDSQTPASSATLSLLASYELFEKDLAEEAVPLVERRRRVQAGKENRWLAGLSRGGSQTFHVGFKRPDLFGALGVFSLGLAATYPDACPLAADAARLAQEYPVIYYAVGNSDSDQLPGYERGKSALTQAGVQFESAMFTGGHIWHVWRQALAEFVVKLK